jgi:hypothetical protein
VPSRWGWTDTSCRAGIRRRGPRRYADGSVDVLHERSRFARVDSRWFYLDGDILDRAACNVGAYGP